MEIKDDPYFEEALRRAGEDAKMSHFYPHLIPMPTAESISVDAEFLRKEALQRQENNRI